MGVSEEGREDRTVGLDGVRMRERWDVADDVVLDKRVELGAVWLAAANLRFTNTLPSIYLLVV